MGLPQPSESITPDEYLRIERTAEFKSEYFAGEVFAMAGGSAMHSLLKTNVTTALSLRMRGRPCKVYDSDLRVLVSATGLFTYPDATVVCGTLETHDGDNATNPTLLVEVLSNSTENYDRTIKFDHYRKIPSLKEVLFVSQEQPIVESFSRDEDGSWKLTDARGLDASIELTSIGVSVPLSEIYDKVEFPPDPLRIRPIP